MHRSMETEVSNSEAMESKRSRTVSLSSDISRTSHESVTILEEKVSSGSKSLPSTSETPCSSNNKSSKSVEAETRDDSSDDDCVLLEDSPAMNNGVSDSLALSVPTSEKPLKDNRAPALPANFSDSENWSSYVSENSGPDSEADVEPEKSPKVKGTLESPINVFSKDCGTSGSEMFDAETEPDGEADITSEKSPRVRGTPACPTNVSAKDCETNSDSEISDVETEPDAEPNITPEESPAVKGASAIPTNVTTEADEEAEISSQRSPGPFENLPSIDAGADGSSNKSPRTSLPMCQPVIVLCKKLTIIAQPNMSVKVKTSKVKRGSRLVCKHCGKRFTKKYKLLVHSRIHNKSHICKICNTEYALKAHLIKHLKTHKNKAANSEGKAKKDSMQKVEGIHQCSICLETFAKSRLLTAHFAVHKEKIPNFQDKVFTKKIKKYIAKIDKSIPKSAKDGKNVEMKKTKAPTAKTKKAKLVTRVETSTPKKNYSNVSPIAETSHVCSICNSSFGGRRLLTAHFKVHKDTNIMSTNAETNEHENDVNTASRKFKSGHYCTVCHAWFGGRRLLAAHSKEHLEKPHEEAPKAPIVLGEKTANSTSKTPVVKTKISQDIEVGTTGKVKSLDDAFKTPTAKTEKAKLVSKFETSTPKKNASNRSPIAETSHVCSICNSSFGGRRLLTAHFKVHKEESAGVASKVPTLKRDTDVISTKAETNEHDNDVNNVSRRFKSGHDCTVGNARFGGRRPLAAHLKEHQENPQDDASKSPVVHKEKTVDSTSKTPVVKINISQDIEADIISAGKVKNPGSETPAAKVRKAKIETSTPKKITSNVSPIAEYSHVCSICNSSFGGRRLLTAHFKVHKEVPTLTGEKATTTNAGTNQHENSVSRMFKTGLECSICSAWFATRRYLTAHYKTHEEKTLDDLSETSTVKNKEISHNIEDRSVGAVAKRNAIEEETNSASPSGTKKKENLSKARYKKHNVKTVNVSSKKPSINIEDASQNIEVDTDVASASAKVEKDAQKNDANNVSTISLTNHVCSICNASFGGRRLLTAHFKVHKKESQSVSLKKVVPTVNDDQTSKERIFICNICNLGFHTRDYFIQHRSEDHGEEVDKSIVAKRIKSKLIRPEYDTTVTKKRKISADAAKARLNTRTDGAGGSAKSKDVKESGVVPKEVGNSTDAEMASTSSHTHKCEVCKATFLFQASLVEHLISHIQQVRHTCNVCEKQFESESRLARHAKMHKKTEDNAIELRSEVHESGDAQSGDSKIRCSVDPSFDRKNAAESNLEAAENSQMHSTSDIGEKSSDVEKKSEMSPPYEGNEPPVGKVKLKKKRAILANRKKRPGGKRASKSVSLGRKLSLAKVPRKNPQEKAAVGGNSDKTTVARKSKPQTQQKATTKGSQLKKFAIRMRKLEIDKKSTSKNDLEKGEDSEFKSKVQLKTQLDKDEKVTTTEKQHLVLKKKKFVSNVRFPTRKRKVGSAGKKVARNPKNTVGEKLKSNTATSDSKQEKVSNAKCSEIGKKLKSNKLKKTESDNELTIDDKKSEGADIKKIKQMKNRQSKVVLSSPLASCPDETQLVENSNSAPTSRKKGKLGRNEKSLNVDDTSTADKSKSSKTQKVESSTSISVDVCPDSRVGKSQPPNPTIPTKKKEKLESIKKSENANETSPVVQSKASKTVVGKKRKSGSTLDLRPDASRENSQASSSSTPTSVKGKRKITGKSKNVEDTPVGPKVKPSQTAVQNLANSRGKRRKSASSADLCPDSSVEKSAIPAPKSSKGKSKITENLQSAEVTPVGPKQRKSAGRNVTNSSGNGGQIASLKLSDKPCAEKTIEFTKRSARISENKMKKSNSPATQTKTDEKNVRLDVKEKIRKSRVNRKTRSSIKISPSKVPDKPIVEESVDPGQMEPVEMEKEVVVGTGANISVNDLRLALEGTSKESKEFSLVGRKTRTRRKNTEMSAAKDSVKSVPVQLEQVEVKNKVDNETEDTDVNVSLDDVRSAVKGTVKKNNSRVSGRRSSRFKSSKKISTSEASATPAVEDSVEFEQVEIEKEVEIETEDTHGLEESFAQNDEINSKKFNGSTDVQDEKMSLKDGAQETKSIAETKSRNTEKTNNLAAHHTDEAKDLTSNDEIAKSSWIDEGQIVVLVDEEGNILPDNENILAFSKNELNQQDDGVINAITEINECSDDLELTENVAVEDANCEVAIVDQSSEIVAYETIEEEAADLNQTSEAAAFETEVEASTLENDSYHSENGSHYSEEAASLDNASLANLMKKSTIQNNKDKFECLECSKVFTDDVQLTQHWITHATSTVLRRCHVCSLTFHDVSSFQRHMTVHNGQETHECKECKKRFVDRTFLEKHMAVHSRGTPEKSPQNTADLKNVKSHPKKRPMLHESVGSKVANDAATTKKSRSHDSGSPDFRDGAGSQMARSLESKISGVRSQKKRFRNLTRDSASPNLRVVQQTRAHKVDGRIGGKISFKSSPDASENPGPSRSKEAKRLRKQVLRPKTDTEKQTFICGDCNDSFSDEFLFILHLQSHIDEIVPKKTKIIKGAPPNRRDNKQPALDNSRMFKAQAERRKTLKLESHDLKGKPSNLTKLSTAGNVLRSEKQIAHAAKTNETKRRSDSQDKAKNSKEIRPQASGSFAKKDLDGKNNEETQEPVGKKMCLSNKTSKQGKEEGLNVGKNEKSCTAPDDKIKLDPAPCNECEKVFMNESCLAEHLMTDHNVIKQQGNDGETLDVVSSQFFDAKVPCDDERFDASVIVSTQSVSCDDEAFETSEIVSTQSSDAAVQCDDEEAYKYECRFCDILYTDSTIFLDHLTRVHKQDVSECFPLGVWPLEKPKQDAADSEKDVNEQKNESQVERKTVKQKQCKPCDKIFPSEFALKRHLRQVHNMTLHEHDKMDDKNLKPRSHKRPFKCRQCGRRFDEEENLTRHLNVHRNDDAGKAGKIDPNDQRKNETLNIVMEPNLSDDVFYCEDCSATFTTRNEYETHLCCQKEVVTVFYCADCSATFTTRNEYETHLCCQKAVVSYKCNQCEYSFDGEDSLNAHICPFVAVVEQSTNVSHECQVCGEFFDRSAIYQHLQDHMDGKN